MSVWARHWALAQSVGGEGASRAARRCVLNDLADWMIGEDEVECCPTIETIAFDTGFNRQTVMKAIAALIEQGLVTRRYEWEGLKKYAYYRFVGYVPREWQGSLRPDAAHPDGPRFKTSENMEVRNYEGMKSRTTGGTKSHTSQGTKSCTYGSTKFRTVPGNRQGITGNKQGIAAVARASATAPRDEAPFPDFEEVPSEALFELEPLVVPEPVPEKLKAKRTRKSKAECAKEAYTGLEAVSDETWAGWTKHRIRRRAVITQGVIDALAKEAEKAGMTLEAAMSEQVGRGWTGFKADWIKRDQQRASNSSTANKGKPLSEADYSTYNEIFGVKVV